MTEWNLSFIDGTAATLSPTLTIGCKGGLLRRTDGGACPQHRGCSTESMFRCYRRDNIITVKVGLWLTPWQKSTTIQWIVIQTEQEISGRFLNPATSLKPAFKVCCGDKVTAAYEYCNPRTVESRSLITIQKGKHMVYVCTICAMSMMRR